MRIHGRGPQLRQRQLRRTVFAQQAIGFLEGVGKLRVAKAAEHRRVVDDFHQARVAGIKIRIVFHAGVTPDLLALAGRRLVEGDAAEFGQHDRLAAMWITIQRQDTSAWAAPVEQVALRRTVAGLQVFGIVVIVVDAENIGCRRFPAVVADYRPGCVERLGQVIQGFNRIAMGLGRGQVGHAPGLVERHPDDDAGMAVVALDHFCPFPDHAADCHWRETVGRRHFFPYQQTQPVGPIQVARVLDLLMLAHAIEAHRLGQFDVAPQGIVGRRGQQRVGPVALVKHHAQGIWTTVEHEAVAADMRRAQRRVRPHPVEHDIAVAQDDFRIQQSRPLGAPQQLVTGVVDARVGQADLAMRLAADHLVAVVGQHLVAMQDARLDRHAVLQVAGHEGFTADFETIEMRRPAQFADVGMRYLLDPDRLPDAGGARIPDRMWLELPVLFAAWLGQVTRIVLCPYGYGLLAIVPQGPRDVGRERRMAAFMHHYQLAIYPDPRLVVNRAEVQQRAAGLPGQGKVALVPAAAVKATVTDAACLGLRRIRHQDFESPVDRIMRIVKAALMVEGETPAAVQREPVVAYQLGSRIGEVRYRVRSAIGPGSTIAISANVAFATACGARIGRNRRNPRCADRRARYRRFGAGHGIASSRGAGPPLDAVKRCTCRRPAFIERNPFGVIRPAAVPARPKKICTKPLQH